MKASLYNPVTGTLVSYYFSKEMTVEEAFPLIIDMPIEKYIDGITYEEIDESHIIQDGDVIYPVIKTDQSSL